MKNYLKIGFRLSLKSIVFGLFCVGVFSAFPMGVDAHNGHGDYVDNTHGYLRVCKIIVSEDGTLATSISNSIPSSTFSVKISQDKNISNSYIFDDNFSSSNFNPNTSIIPSSPREDAVCVTHKVLIGDYYYSEESISGDLSRWNAPKYYDGKDEDYGSVLNLASLYNSQLFNDNQSDDYLVNVLSDGYVSITSNQTRTIIVLNTYKKLNTPVSNICNALFIDKFTGLGDYSKFIHKSYNSENLANHYSNSLSLGGQLEASFVGVPTSFGSSISFSALGSTTMEFANSSLSNGKVLFVWDGLDNDLNNINYTGLNHTNLSFNGERDSIKFNYSSDFVDNKNIVLTFTIYTNQNNASRLVLPLYGAHSELLQGEVKLNDFITFIGEGALMNDVGAITLEIDATSRNGYDFALSGLELNCLTSNGHLNTAPQITLTGSNPANLTIGQLWMDPGATATDTEDGNLTSHIITTGTVGTTTGTYILTYTVTDSGGLSASTTRSVVVSNPNQPTNPDTSGAATIIATTIVCDSESDLPNWGIYGPDVTASTSVQFLASHPNCHPVSGWKYQWGYEGQVTDPSVTFVGEASPNWNTFGPTDINGVATTSINATTTTIWFREVLKEGYIPFTYPVNNDFSAEMYCDKDVLNYHNYEYIENVSKGHTYYCIALNVPKVSIGHLNTPPQITLTGSNPANLTIGQLWMDPGATATDTEDGNLTSHIVTTGTVGTTTGTYILTYTVTDSGGLSASTTRSVVVSNPVTNTPKGKLKFCASFADENNVIATTSSQLPQGTFKLDIATSTNFTNSTINSKTWTNINFLPTNKILLTTEKDADCVVWDNLDLGTYYYSDVLVSGNVWQVKQYSDQFNQPVNNIFDLFNYSGELFNATSTDDSSRNPNSDGMIEISASQREHTIVIVFKHKKVAQNPSQCLIPEITSALVSQAVSGQAFNYQITASSTATTTLNFSIGTSTLPMGLVFSTTTNTISGIPTETGTFSVNLSITNSCGLGTAKLSIIVNAPASGGGCSSNCGGGSGGGGGSVPVNTGGGGGGNGPIVVETLKIFNEKVVEVVSGIALVTWDTNLGATRQVGYGNTSVVFASSTEPFGYATSTVLINSPLSKTHSMAITIEHGKTYYFRPVSRDTSNSVIGKELVLNPAVSGGSTSNQCYYLYDYLKQDWDNNPIEVKKLQVFLRDLEGQSVNVTGIYDDQTVLALNAFQNKYKDDILTPWGHTEPTSFTYITTKKKVNEIYCKKAFPVNAIEQSEIDAFRNFLAGLSGAGITLPVDQSVDWSLQDPVIDTDEVGIVNDTDGSLVELTTLAGSSTKANRLASSLTAAVVTSGKLLGSWFSKIATWPWNWSDYVFSKDNQCKRGDYGSLLNWILILIILLLTYLWHRERRSYKKSIELNKELDLNK